MKLRTLEATFLQGKIDKPSYITQMYQMHDKLFEYADFITDRDISEITITPNCVVFTTNNTSNGGGGVKLLAKRHSERMVPIEILNFKSYERFDSEMIFSLVKDEYVIFDVGGNIGWYSIALAKAKRNLIIHAFEPIPSTYEQFVANAQYNGVQITINNCALFDKQCDLKFYVYEQDFGNASATIMHEEKDNKEIICKTTTLDMYAKEQNLTRLDFIKCDIEGAEFFALKGGLKTLEQYKPILFVEMLRKWAGKYNYHPNDIIDLLGNLGYMCYFVCHRESTLKLTRLEKMTEETRETNFFFLHKEKHKSQIENFVL